MITAKQVWEMRLQGMILPPEGKYAPEVQSLIERQSELMRESDEIDRKLKELAIKDGYIETMPEGM